MVNIASPRAFPLDMCPAGFLGSWFLPPLPRQWHPSLAASEVGCLLEQRAVALWHELMLFQAMCMIFCKDFVPSGWMLGSAGMSKPLAATQALVWTPAMDLEGFFTLVVS